LFSFLKITYIALFVGSLAICGFPFLTGFYSKDLLIEQLLYTYYIELNSTFLIFLCCFSVIFTSIYSLRILFFVFFDQPNFLGFVTKLKEPFSLLLYSILILVFCSIFCGFVFSDLFIGSGNGFWAADSIIVTLFFFDLEYNMP
jgi:NADH:ubiquinone oxidoreductase subunit 5 (subunit L)/multisubunit Na+/H+ antiporter MnhA subunit